MSARRKIMAVQDSQSAASRTGTFTSRWLIPVAAVAIHICIGSLYERSTFNLPIQGLFPNDPWLFSPTYITFITAIVLLGLSAAFGGPWVERRGPRGAGTAGGVFLWGGRLLGRVGVW